MAFLAPYEGLVLGLMRILAGISFATHGAQKLFGLFGGTGGGMPAPMLYTAGAIEFFGGLLIALGLFSGIAAFVASGMMAVAYFIAHFPRLFGDFPEGFFPIKNGGELALLYCWVFLYVAARGPGALAIQPASDT